MQRDCIFKFIILTVRIFNSHAALMVICKLPIIKIMACFVAIYRFINNSEFFFYDFKSSVYSFHF
ncbi:unknown [Salmonella phage FelixO1]|uniref:Uncharacterized protein n=1 Tax=Salmonella phage Felix O1 (isolate Felix O1-VT1) TaxID=1283336 RepID=Q6KGS2_BPFO1|nr:unknown [Salmonella phage FelixO1]